MCFSSSSDNASTHIDAALYKAATDGKFELFENYAQPLDHLIIGKRKNTILHLHLNSPCEVSEHFVEKVLAKCPLLLWKMNSDGDVPLHFAAKYGLSEIVKLLVEETKKPIHRDLETCEEEETTARRMLRSKNKQHETALHLAARGDYLKVVKEILKHEECNYIYTANQCGESPLYLAVKYGYEAIADDILKNFKSPDPSGSKGATVFHAAVSYNSPSPSLFDSLLNKQGSFVSQADESGWTPLHLAAYMSRSLEVGKILEKDDCSAYATDKERKRTALHMASCRGKVDFMKQIIRKCPQSCEISDVRSWNVLHYAVISRDKKAVKTLMKDSSLVYLIKERDIKGYTPLHLLLASHNNSSLLSWLTNGALEPSEFLVCEIVRLLKIQPYENIYESEEIVEWMKDLGNDPFGKKIIISKSWGEKEKEIEEKVIPELEKAKDSHLVAAAIVATVTFAAAFTLPGGYISDENHSKLKGTPILTRNTAFIAFVVSDAVAMVLSTTSVFMHFIMALLGYKLRYYWLIRSAFWSIVVAMGAMVVAFVAGTYAVLAPNSMELGIVTCLIGLTFFVYLFGTSIRLIFHFIRCHRAANPSLSLPESARELLDAAPRYLSYGFIQRKKECWNFFIRNLSKLFSWSIPTRTDSSMHQVHSNNDDEV